MYVSSDEYEYLNIHAHFSGKTLSNASESIVQKMESKHFIFFWEDIEASLLAGTCGDSEWHSVETLSQQTAKIVNNMAGVGDLRGCVNNSMVCSSCKLKVDGNSDSGHVGSDNINSSCSWDTEDVSISRLHLGMTSFC